LALREPELAPSEAVKARGEAVGDAGDGVDFGFRDVAPLVAKPQSDDGFEQRAARSFDVNAHVAAFGAEPFSDVEPDAVGGIAGLLGEVAIVACDFFDEGSECGDERENVVEELLTERSSHATPAQLP